MEKGDTQERDDMGKIDRDGHDSMDKSEDDDANDSP